MLRAITPGRRTDIDARKRASRHSDQKSIGGRVTAMGEEKDVSAGQAVKRVRVRPPCATATRRLYGLSGSVAAALLPMQPDFSSAVVASYRFVRQLTTSAGLAFYYSVARRKTQMASTDSSQASRSLCASGKWGAKS